MPETKKRILIVDDEPYIIRSLGFVLKRAGFEVYEARNGAQALEIVQQHQPDLAFLDIMMPQMDGFEVCRRIRASKGTADIPVIMLTAKTQEGDRERALEAGANEYMTKPFSPTQAVKQARALLGGTN